jgi:serine/threonine protein kinase
MRFNLALFSASAILFEGVESSSTKGKLPISASGSLRAASAHPVKAHVPKGEESEEEGEYEDFDIDDFGYSVPYKSDYDRMMKKEPAAKPLSHLPVLAIEAGSILPIPGTDQFVRLLELLPSEGGEDDAALWTAEISTDPSVRFVVKMMIDLEDRKDFRAFQHEVGILQRLSGIAGPPIEDYIEEDEEDEEEEDEEDEEDDDEEDDDEEEEEEEEEYKDDEEDEEEEDDDDDASDDEDSSGHEELSDNGEEDNEGSQLSHEIVEEDHEVDNEDIPAAEGEEPEEIVEVVDYVAFPAHAIDVNGFVRIMGEPSEMVQSIYSNGKYHAYRYFIMEQLGMKVSDPRLVRALNAEAALRIPIGFRFAREAIKILRSMHGMGYFHNDVHAGNFMYTSRLEAADDWSSLSRDHGPAIKIIDFGLSRRIPAQVMRTTPWVGIGASLMAPFEMDGFVPTVRDDLYRLGEVILGAIGCDRLWELRTIRISTTDLKQLKKTFIPSEVCQNSALTASLDIYLDEVRRLEFTTLNEDGMYANLPDYERLISLFEM